MSYVTAAPQLVAAAASDLAGIGAALRAANAAAAGLTTQVSAAAADEVSTAIAAVFGAYAQSYQALSAQGAVFHDQFVQALNAAAGSYASAEATNASLLQNATAAGDPGAGAILIMGPTGSPQPGLGYMSEVYTLYLQQRFPGYPFSPQFTPEQFQPFTGIPSLGFDQSVAQGATDLNAAIMARTGQDLVVLGFSQSSTVASFELRYLETLPVSARPSPDQLSFVLLGDPSNPDGGILERLPGLFLQPLGLTFSGATPDTVYPTTVYTMQYDGFADFPQYPIDIPADLNALLGIYYAHGLYYQLTPAQVASGVVQPVSPADTHTTYILIPNQNLPLLEPLRGIVPAPLLDLIRPDLRVIIDMGYDPTGYANVPTPAGLFPTDVNPIAVAGDLAQGTAQGIDTALADEGLAPLPSLPKVPLLAELSNASLTLPALPTIAVPPQLGEAVDRPLNDLDGVLNTVINDRIDPAITSAIYGSADALSAAAISHGASPQLTNAIFIGKQILPVVVEGPGYLVTGDTQYLVGAIEDLAAGDIGGVGQDLQLIPATDIALGVIGVGISGLAVGASIAGKPFPT